MEQPHSDNPSASLEIGCLNHGAAIMTRRWLAVVPLILSLQIVGPSAAQDTEFDLTIDFDALHYDSPDPMADDPPEGLSPGWNRHPRVDWSRPTGKSWELDPVLLHRRQAGNPDRPGDDLSNKTLGVELRRRF
jgi:hypothetical protein